MSNFYLIDNAFFLLTFFFRERKSKLLACLFDSNCNSNSHTNHGVVTCADETHHLYVKLSYEEAFPINILGDEHIIWMRS